MVKPRLANRSSFEAEEDLVRALIEALGKMFLHDITPQDAETAKMAWISKRRANSTVKKRLGCLRRMMDYAISLGYIRENRIPVARGLPVSNRSDIWLKTEEIDRLLLKCDPTIRPIVEFFVLTGARVGEARDFRREDLRADKLLLPTEKRRRPPREAMRAFNIASLGPRFARLLPQLKANPKSGYIFFLEDNNLSPISYSYLHQKFLEARKTASLPHFRLHDLRGTFAMHRAMVVRSFRQLQTELGHGDARSIQSYLDRTEHFNPEESIFHGAPQP